MEDFRTNQKEEAIEIMKELKLSETIIQQFEENGILYRSEIAAYTKKLTKNEQKMVDKFQQRTGSLVYHVIKDQMSCDRLYLLLCVSSYEEDWRIGRNRISAGMASVYVVNKDRPEYNKYSCIGVIPCCGGLIRIY